MSIKIKVWRDPYDACFNTTEAEEIEFEEGLTILVGCNGAGKTTLLRNIEEYLNEQKIPGLYYNNRTDGDRSNMMYTALNIHENVNMVATLAQSSEGETINIGLGSLASTLKYFIKNGRKYSRMNQFLSPEEQPKIPESNKRIILLDAIDSGFSIDNIIDLKKYLFNFVLEDAKKNGYEMYFIVSANTYELANHERCLDVMSGEYISFNNYEEFRQFILDSKEKKEKRLDIAEELQKKRKKKNKWEDSDYE